jgi:hypothetical protein
MCPHQDGGSRIIAIDLVPLCLLKGKEKVQHVAIGWQQAYTAAFEWVSTCIELDRRGLVRKITDQEFEEHCMNPLRLLALQRSKLLVYTGYDSSVLDLRCDMQPLSMTQSTSLRIKKPIRTTAGNVCTKGGKMQPLHFKKNARTRNWWSVSRKSTHAQCHIGPMQPLRLEEAIQALATPTNAVQTKASRSESRDITSSAVGDGFAALWGSSGKLARPSSSA